MTSAYVRTTVLALAVSAAVPAFAQQQPKPEQEIRYRQSVMNVMGRNFGKLNAMAKGDIPYNKDEAVLSAQVVQMLSTLPFGSFGPGTEKGAPTKADMKIWNEPEKFRNTAQKMQAAAKKLPAAAADPGSLKSAVGELGKTCKSCHDDYQLKEARS